MDSMKYLVADLDGTLIPWEGLNQLGSFDSLERLKQKMKENNLRLIYLTGRSFATIMDAMRDYPLPEPELIFSSAGAALYRKAGRNWESCIDHKAYLEGKNPRWNRAEMVNRIASVESLRSQGEIHQSEYKISYFLYSLDYEPVIGGMEEKLSAFEGAFSIQIYPEPEMGWCYVDIMALEADKRGALDYLSAREIHHPYVFAGDNWNDRSAFLSDHPSILVGNTPEDLKRETEEKNPRQFIARGSSEERSGKFADGVLEGLESLGWVL
ncbi:MAG: hypothetical protein JXA95_02380 [Spirochaetales bacterium]|nr:hypothetical protein [Spirochaetales bacterium]